MFVRGVVVADDVGLPCSGSELPEQIQKADPLLMPVLLHAGADDLARGNVQRGKEPGGSVAFVVMRHRGRAALLEGKPRLRAIQRPGRAERDRQPQAAAQGWSGCDIDLALFIAGKHQPE